ncbi:unnamed protein product [Mortierella alpina]
MEINTGPNMDDTEKELAQLMVDTGTEGSSAVVIALTRGHVLFRSMLPTGFTTRQVAGLGSWTLPRTLIDGYTAQLQYSNKFLYLFSAAEAYDPSLLRLPFDPRGTIPSEASDDLPKGTTSIDISTANNCTWTRNFSTAVSGNKFYLLCQAKKNSTLSTRVLFVYDNTPGAQSPKLSAPVPVTGIHPSCTINLFQPLGNRSYAMIGCNEQLYGTTAHSLLALSGSNAGAATPLGNTKIWLQHDTLFNNILPDQDEIKGPSSDGVFPKEGIIGLIFGVLGVLAAIAFLLVRNRRRQRSIQNSQKGAATNSDALGIKPLGASARSHLSPSVYAAPHVSISPSPALSAGPPVSSRPTSPPAVERAAPLSSTTMSPAPSRGSPPADFYEMELQQLGFWSHPRPNIVTTMSD